MRSSFGSTSKSQKASQFVVGYYWKSTTAGRNARWARGTFPAGLGSARREFLSANLLCYIRADIRTEATSGEIHRPAAAVLVSCACSILQPQQTRQLTSFLQTLLANERAANDVSADRALNRWSELVADDAWAAYDSGFATKAEVRWDIGWHEARGMEELTR